MSGRGHKDQTSVTTKAVRSKSSGRMAPLTGVRQPSNSSRSLAAAAKSLQSCLTLCDPIDVWQPTRFPRPWDSPGKNTGVGCHFLLQCIKVKSESDKEAGRKAAPLSEVAGTWGGAAWNRMPDQPSQQKPGIKMG